LRLGSCEGGTRRHGMYTLSPRGRSIVHGLGSMTIPQRESQKCTSPVWTLHRFGGPKNSSGLHTCKSFECVDMPSRGYAVGSPAGPVRPHKKKIHRKHFHLFEPSDTRPFTACSIYVSSRSLCDSATCASYLNQILTLNMVDLNSVDLYEV